MAEQPSSLDQTLAAAAAGDGQAWAELVSTYSGRVFGLIYKQCRDKELAEEIAQETFVKVVQKLTSNDGYNEQGKFEPWLFRIAMNKLRDEMRRRGRQAKTMDMSPAATASSNENASGWAVAEAGVIAGGPSMPDAPLDQLDRAEQVDLLKQAIATLPEADQEVLHMRHTAGLSFAQIAESLDQPLGTVLARGHRALGKLKKLMNPEPNSQANTA
ncbi:MAG: sigma-70 family RNA polymerase sigma factor [Planctomycetota bacterium]